MFLTSINAKSYNGSHPLHNIVDTLIPFRLIIALQFNIN